jgi:hypothetical protein
MTARSVRKRRRKTAETFPGNRASDASTISDAICAFICRIQKIGKNVDFLPKTRDPAGL